jgi:hypothetical protein
VILERLRRRGEDADWQQRAGAVVREITTVERLANAGALDGVVTTDLTLPDSILQLRRMLQAKTAGA